VLTSFAEDEKVYAAIKAGALGYLLKDASPQEILAAIREVHRGEPSLPPVIAHKLMSELHRTSNLPPTEDPLTDTRHRRDPFIPFQKDGTPTRRTDQKDLTGFS